MKPVRDQLENYKCKLEVYKRELKNQFTSRMEKFKEYPELDEKIDTINRIWDAIENLEYNVSQLESKLNDRIIYEDFSRIDDLYPYLNSARETDLAYQKNTTELKWMQLGEVQYNIFNPSRSVETSNFIDTKKRKSSVQKNLPDF